MTTLPVPGFFNDPTRINSSAKDGLDALTEFSREGVGGKPETTLTIVSGTITPTTGIHAVDTESAAPTDDLANISTATIADGRSLLIRCADNGRAVTVKHAAGGGGSMTLNYAADFVLNSTRKWLMLKRTGANWEELFRSYGADTGAIRTQLGLGTAALVNTGVTAGTVPLLGAGGALPAIPGGALTGLYTVPLGVPLPYFGIALPVGYIWARGFTIGRSGSAGSERANDDCFPLFNHLWYHMADAQAPVSGGRGPDSTTDFNANKTIRVPDCRGKTLVCMDNVAGGGGAGYIGNVIAGTVLGAIGGSEVHYLTYDQSGLRDHVHGYTDNQHLHSMYEPAGGHAHPDGDSGHGHPGATVATHLDFFGSGDVGRVAGDGFTRTDVASGAGLGYAATGVGMQTLAAYSISTYWGTSNITINGPGNFNSINWHNNLQPSITCTYIMRL